MVKSAVIVLALIGAALAAPPAPAPERIVGGSATTIQEYPYMASLQSLAWGITWSHFCGGSLLTSGTILSAAHCFYNSPSPSEWRVRVGSTFKSSGGQVIDASRLTLHENYDNELLSNDVAIIVLSRSPILSNAVQPVRIPPTEYQIPDNTVITAIGWGALQQQGTSAEQLQHVDITVINQQICKDRYDYLGSTIPSFPVVNDGMMCSGILDDGGKDACQGDSGGPVSLKTAEGHVLVGVTSWGYGCAHPIYPGVNARTSYYSDWIVQNGSV